MSSYGLSANPPPQSGGTFFPVETVQNIRRANLALLLQECAKDIGRERGAAAELTRRTGVPDSFISQFLNRRPHARGGERSMGDSTARKLERGMDKPMGWMDVDRSIARNHEEADMLDAIRTLTSQQRQTIAVLIAQFSEANFRGGPIPPESPDDRPSRH